MTARMPRQRIPLMSWRLLQVGGRPAFLPLGSNGSSLAHCSLVRSPRPMPGASHESIPLLKQALVRCLLGAADKEFTRDTAESVARARVLYTTALDLLGPAPQPRQACATLLVPLDAEIGAHIDRTDPSWHGVWNRLRQSLEELDEPATLHATIDQVRAVWAAGGPIAQRLAAVTGLVERAHAEAPAPA